MLSAVLSAFANAVKIADLRRKIAWTLGIIAVYRLGAYVPTPGIDGEALGRFFQQVTTQAGGGLFGLMNLFSGGSLNNMTVFALGIMPYISASIIMQLLTVVFPQLEKLAKEGIEGRRQLIQYTRYGTIVLGILQSFFIALWLENPGNFFGVQIVPFPGWGFRLLTVLTLTTGTAFIMWLGETIDEKGIGNGMSLLITASIVSSIPTAAFQTWALLSPFEPQRRQIQPVVLGLMSVVGIGVVIAVVLLTQGQRQIPVQYAKRVVGRRVYGGQSNYIPLKVNMAGVIPIIFAQSILLFPATISGFVQNPYIQSVADFFTRPGLWHNLIYSALIVFFCYFYTAIAFNPVDVAENMQKYGGFIPGIRPGKPTAQYFDYILTRITLPGAVFLSVIAILPSIVSAGFKIPFLVASFFGGTGLLIIVGVMLDTMKQIESQLIARHYDGFMKTGRLRARTRYA